ADHVPPAAQAAPAQAVAVGGAGGAGYPLARAADPQPVEITADPGPVFPGERAAGVGVLPLEAVEQHPEIDLRRVLHVMAQLRERGGPVGVGDRRDRFARLRDGFGVVAVVLVMRVSSCLGVRFQLLRLVVLALGMTGGGDGAQRGCKQGEVEGVRKQAPSPTRTSRNSAASMW